MLKSGNPGYLLGFPVLLGYRETADSAVQVYDQGFALVGVNNDGSCQVFAEGTQGDISFAPKVNYKQSLSFGCTQQVSNGVVDLKAACEQQMLFDLNLRQVKLAGEYGNANPNFTNVSTALLEGLAHCRVALFKLGREFIHDRNNSNGI
jgi:hypothetical protein